MKNTQLAQPKPNSGAVPAHPLLAPEVIDEKPQEVLVITGEPMRAPLLRVFENTPIQPTIVPDFETAQSRQ